MPRIGKIWKCKSEGTCELSAKWEGRCMDGSSNNGGNIVVGDLTFISHTAIHGSQPGHIERPNDGIRTSHVGR
jgi:hypothetical protein